MDGNTVAIFVSVLGLLVLVISYAHTKHLQRTIERQNDTIQRLLNREPVTYAEVGTKQPKPIRERYAAWGAQMVNLDDEEENA